ncbi:MAG: pilus assembly protein [Lachnospiraceae bacterium]|nr:pilus assembly protein [Lachnospiraceae bacterium]
MIRDKKACMEGSITVEAGLLVPFVILVIVTMIFLSFYLHDAVHLDAMLHKLTDEAVNYVAYEVNPQSGLVQYENAIHQSILYFAGISKETKERILESYCKEQLESGFFITTVLQIQADIDISMVKIKVKAHSQIPVRWISSLFPQNLKSRTVTMKKSYFKREEITRLLTVASETGEQIKGVSEAAEKVKDIVNKIR